MRFRLRPYCVLILLAAWVAVIATPSMSWAARSTDAITQIETAAATGQLDFETAILYKIRAIRNPQLLPEPFRRAAQLSPVKCGTPVVVEAYSAFPRLSLDVQAEIQAAMARPVTDSVYFSPGGHFAIHYDLDSVNAVSSADNDSSGFPDFIEDLARYFDSSWAYEVDDLGWRRPPSDGIAGGDSLYDVYPTSIGLTYGYTIQDAPGPEPWDDFSSYIYVNKSFVGFPPNDDPDGDKAGAMKVTAAHEFNHACQFATDALHLHATESWWQELSATWIEDIVYDPVNDNYNYLDEFFPVPGVSLFDGSDHKYGAFVFAKHMEEAFDTVVVRNAWEYMRWQSAKTGVDSALIDVGSAFSATFGTFSEWNYFTGSRDDGAHYSDAADYLMVPYSTTHSTYPVLDRSSVTFGSMAADYVNFLPDPMGRDVVRINFNGTNGIPWGAAVWQFDSAGTATAFPFTLDPVTGDGAVYVGHFNDMAHAVLIAANENVVSGTANYRYSVDFLIRADCDNDKDADIFDVLYLIDAVYSGGPTPQPIWQVGDLNCSGGLDALDVSVIVDYVLKGGPKPCPPID